MTKATATERRSMSVFVKMIIVFFIVLVVGSATARPATVSGGTNEVHARMNPVGPVDAYHHCYRVFEDNFYDAALSLHSLCQLRDKLNVCKQRVKAAFPKVEDGLILGGWDGVEEFLAKFWCTHTPVPYIPMYALYYKFMTCPNVYEWFIVIPEDYSAHTRITYNRAELAYDVLKGINIPSLTRWHPHSNYSDPADPVYKALNSVYCVNHHHTQYRAQILDKYCIIGDIYRDWMAQLARHGREHFDGLYNWDPSMCLYDHGDPIEMILKIIDLEAWFNLQVNSSLDQCHASNVAVRGGCCIIVHYTRIPPYIDLHLFMQGFCEPINELSQCWNEVLQMCRKQSVSSDMDVLIKLHQLACELSLQNSSLVWDVIYGWSDAARKVRGSQVIMQTVLVALNILYESPIPPTTVIPLPFASTLNATLTYQPHITPQIRNLLQQLVSHLDRINLLQIYRFVGLNLMHKMFQINPIIAYAVTTALHGPVELLLTIGGFIDYDPNNFRQWTFFYP